MALPIRKGATHKVVLGPAVAVGDGFTPITNLDVSTSDEAEVILHDNGTVVDISGYTWAAITTADGYYHLTLQTGISNTVGHMTVVINDDSLCLPITKDFIVMDTGAYDALYASTSTILTSFDIALLYESTIGTVTSQTEFIMDVAFAVDDTWNGNSVSLEDVSTGEIYSGNVWISDGVQSTESLHVNVAFPVTVVAGDKIRIYAEQHPTYALTLHDTATAAQQTSDTASIVAKLLAYFRLALRSDPGPTTDNSIELTAINNDEGAGGGDYDSGDSLEARADTVDDVNVTKFIGQAYKGDGSEADKLRSTLVT